MDRLTGKIKSFDERQKTITFEVLKVWPNNKSTYNKIETIKVNPNSTKHKLDPSIINYHILIHAFSKNTNVILGNYQINKTIKYEAEPQDKL